VTIVNTGPDVFIITEYDKTVYDDKEILLVLFYFILTHLEKMYEAENEQNTVADLEGNLRGREPTPVSCPVLCHFSTIFIHFFSTAGGEGAFPPLVPP
jgi:hypothetical protein